MREKQRLVWTAGICVAVVGLAVLKVPHETQEATSLKSAYAAAEKQVTLARTGDPFMEAVQHGGDSDGHDHNAAATKNAITRATESGPLTQDRTTERRAREAVASVAAERKARQPRLVPGFTTRPRADVPEDRFAMAGGCYTLRAPSGFVQRSGGTPVAAGPGAEPFHFQATRLGRYLLFGTKADYLGMTSLLGLLGHAPAFVAAPSEDADWVVDAKNGGYAFTLPSGRGLVAAANGTLAIGPAAAATAFQLRTASGCAAWPEIDTNVSQPFKAASLMQEARGYADTHTHGMTHEFLGGMVLCGRPWHPYGVTSALVDCPDHTSTSGYGAILETFLSGGNAGHDTVGWPTFSYWPNAHSLTHQALYYKWLERSWRGGLRVFTNLLTENNVLCELYPLKKNSCNDMDSIRLQAKDMRELQDYIDAQYGGPGRGWYRIVKDPFEARRVVNEGKLAVIMGIETSVPFDCNVGVRQPQCTEASIDKALDEVYALGVRQMEITNKFDNGLTGVAGDAGTTGVLTNFANFLNTGSFLRMQACPGTFPPGVQDQQQVATPDGTLPEQDAIFGGIAQLFAGLGTTALPAYTAKPHCNQAGLTPLGEHLINRMIDKGMLFDPDHMSVIARRQALDLLEEASARGRHPGVISSHSWSTPDAYPRIYKLGGFITPYAGDSKGFLAKWQQHLKWRDPRYYFGFGYGADINGFGTQGSARNPGEADDVDYPFTGLGGVTVDRERGGQRVWDVNTDGVAHYGLYPDWIRDVQVLAGAGGPAFLADMARGSEGYLQTWERSLGIGNDGCRDPRALRKLNVFKKLRKGMATTRVLRKAGQPHTRIGRKFTYCAQKPGAKAGKKVRVKVVFTDAGKVKRVRLPRA